MTLSDLTTMLSPSTLAFKLLSFVKTSFEENEEKVMELQRKQLFEGIRSDGQPIRPYYSEDLQSKGGYFKTQETANKYAEWKASMTYPVQTSRPLDVPNLYIAKGDGEGRFHRELGMVLTDLQMKICGTTPYADDIVDKYGLETFGLTDESMEELMPTIKQRVVEQLRDYING